MRKMPTTKQIDELQKMIDNGGGSGSLKIFRAIYKTTTFAELDAAYNSGEYDLFVAEIHYEDVRPADTGVSYLNLETADTDRQIYRFTGSATLQEKIAVEGAPGALSNKGLLLTKNDTDEIFIAIYGTTTGVEIKAAVDAGKMVFVKGNLTISGPGTDTQFAMAPLDRVVNGKYKFESTTTAVSQGEGVYMVRSATVDMTDTDASTGSSGLNGGSNQYLINTYQVCGRYKYQNVHYIFLFTMSTTESTLTTQIVEDYLKTKTSDDYVLAEYCSTTGNTGREGPVKLWGETEQYSAPCGNYTNARTGTTEVIGPGLISSELYGYQKIN